MSIDQHSLSQRERRGRIVIGLCALLAMLFAIAGIVNGPLNVTLPEVFAALTGIGEVSSVKEGVILNIRAPRMILGLTAGAALAASGTAMQGFFRNPLADPGLIGVSAGGAFAAVFVIVLGGSLLGAVSGVLGMFTLPIAAFFGSFVVVLSIYRLSVQDGRVIVATMLLAGVAANSLVTAGIGYLTFLADDTQLRDLTFWTLGSLGGATWGRVLPASALMVISTLGLLTLARPLNGLLFGEGDASALGINVEMAKRRAAVLTALGVGAATAVCGIVGFIGLVVPHLVRLMTGPDHRFVLPGSAFLGGALVLAADLIARLAVVPAELPLGVVTAAIGAPFFFWLLLRDKKRSALG
ncbi:MAG: iron ABC transporter permease [Pseudomonadota bacterium]